MAVKDTSIDDLAEAIGLLSTTVTEGFAGLNGRMGTMEGRMGKLEGRMTDMEANQRQTNQRLEVIEGSLQALEADIKELYVMVGELKKDFGRFTAEDQQRFARLEAFALEVSKQTGIPFQI